MRRIAVRDPLLQLGLPAGARLGARYSLDQTVISYSFLLPQAPAHSTPQSPTTGPGAESKDLVQRPAPLTNGLEDIKMNIRIPVLVSCLTMLALGNVAAASDHDNGVRYYLSLGTSLSVGMQPDASGANQLTDEGYADQLHDIVGPQFRRLKLTKLGCPGETTATMMNGGKCDYEEGSQLAQAVEFLHAHKDKVAIVTIDMGVNDVLAANCIDVSTSNVDSGCLFSAFGTLANNLITVVTALKQAAHPDTKIIAMNYYNTFLAFWLTGLEGQVLAHESALLADYLNHNVLGYVYTAFEVPVADVAAAFESGNFGTSATMGLPQNVLNICVYTYMCADTPVGPNIHANRYGYGVIAATIAATL